jgi:hypothetical protein
MSAKKIKQCVKKERGPRLGMNDIEWDRLVKTVEEIKEEADKKLKEVSDICLKRECDVK